MINSSSKKNKKLLVLLKSLRNIYVLVFIAFIIWMTIFDTNSWMIHSELNKDIKTLNSKIKFYSTEIAKDRKEIKTLSSDDGIEKYAREHHKMKKDNEVIYLIEDQDSLNFLDNE